MQLQQELDKSSNNTKAPVPPAAVKSDASSAANTNKSNNESKSNNTAIVVPQRPAAQASADTQVPKAGEKSEYAQAAELEAIVGVAGGGNNGNKDANTLPLPPATPSSSGVRMHQPGLTPPGGNLEKVDSSGGNNNANHTGEWSSGGLFSRWLWYNPT